MTDRIVAAALAHPDLGADRLARLLGEEGVDVSRGLVYRTLRAQSLQNRKLRARFLEEQGRLRVPADETEPKEAPGLPSETLPEQTRETSRLPVFMPGIEYAAPPESAPEEDKPETPAGVVPAYEVVSAGAPPIERRERAHLGKEKWLFRGINLLLGIFIVLLGIHIGVRLYDARQEPNAAATPPASAEAAAEAGETVEPNRPLSDYQVILDRNLFGVENHPASDPARETAEIKAIGLAGNEVGLKLIGTAVGKDRRKNYAVLEVAKTRSQEILRERDTVANVRIKRILRNNVIILTPAGEKRLTVDDKPTAGSPASPVQPVTAGVNIPGTLSADDEDKEITIEIPRSSLTEALPDIRQRLEDLNISANMNIAKPEGFYLGRLMASDVLYRIGMRTGDIIKSVDGEAIEGPGDAERFLQRMSRGGNFSILVERRGKLQSLDVSIE